MMMKTATLKIISPLIVTYGVTATDASKLFDKGSQATHINAGWIVLHHGSDKSGGKILFAETDRENLLIYSKQCSATAKRRPKSRGDWAYGIESLPYDFFGNSQRPFAVFCDDDQVKFGQDSHHRAYMTVLLTELKVNLLFRDPTSKSSAAWNPPPAIGLCEGLSLRSKSTVAGLARVKSGDATGDDDLDDLLSQLSAI